MYCWKSFITKSFVKLYARILYLHAYRAFAHYTAYCKHSMLVLSMSLVTWGLRCMWLGWFIQSCHSPLPRLLTVGMSMPGYSSKVDLKHYSRAKALAQPDGASIFQVEGIWASAFHATLKRPAISPKCTTFLLDLQRFEAEHEAILSSISPSL